MKNLCDNARHPLTQYQKFNANNFAIVVTLTKCIEKRKCFKKFLMQIEGKINLSYQFKLILEFEC